MARGSHSTRKSAGQGGRFASFVSTMSRLLRYHPPAKWQYVILFILLIVGLLLNSVIMQHG